MHDWLRCYVQYIHDLAMQVWTLPKEQAMPIFWQLVFELGGWYVAYIVGRAIWRKWLK